MIDIVETVVKTELPVDEELKIQKHRLMPDGASVKKLEEESKRIAIVTGIHGDELEGQYVCYELINRIRNNSDALEGIVDIYPAMNPFGIDNITRGIPAFDLDMNRLFPGNDNGDMNEYIAAEIMKDMEGTALVFDIHASNIFLTEVPQIRVNEQHKDALIPLARMANVDFIWVHGASTVLESTFAHSLNSRGINTLVVEMGVGMRITKEYGDQLAEGIFSLMFQLGIWKEETHPDHNPIVCNNGSGHDVYYLNADVSGVFMKEKTHGAMIDKDEIIGVIVNPLTGDLLSTIKAPVNGWLFTIREYPVVDEGSLLGRILCSEALG